ncbi:hypothetical protein SAMN05216266_1129 [Amycolatopsis marina]|uniref:J domain-containing protein n=1 Tax=Amycolatopsis marina TaxID=490629 RepID=A0A1I1B5X7_9PSEU|nr:hypothetical protein [Amycolatopsis marina]SFB45162.1 hypothetical protein SAMN05216266_1129 [Amycolatopsis marina]
MSHEPDREARERAEFRAFVREHHPDVGGDPQEFLAGLARFREARGPRSTRQGPDEPGHDRYDAPVYFAAREPGVVGRVKRWRQRRRRPPRVR